MAMFVHRLLQNMLDHLAAHLPLEAREKLARELNRQSSSALGFEWEAALLFGLAAQRSRDASGGMLGFPRLMPRPDAFL
jgi:hypothetical protein